MADPGSGRHTLDFAGANGRTVAHAVLVAEFAFDDVRHDFHIPVGVGRKTAALGKAVVVDDSQLAKTHMFRIVVIGEREAWPGLQPTVIGKTLFICASNLNHLTVSFL